MVTQKQNLSVYGLTFLLAVLTVLVFTMKAVKTSLKETPVIQTTTIAKQEMVHSKHRLLQPTYYKLE